MRQAPRDRRDGPNPPGRFDRRRGAGPPAAATEPVVQDLPDPCRNWPDSSVAFTVKQYYKLLEEHAAAADRLYA
jgi:hypothetical protein